jgi:hypothetical protein
MVWGSGGALFIVVIVENLLAAEIRETVGVAESDWLRPVM